MTVSDLFIDVALASMLILVGQFLRAKITFLQQFFIPASMIAGFLGLIFGPGVLGLLPFSGSISSYAGILIILIFTVVGVNGFKLRDQGGMGKEEVSRLVSYQLYRLIAFFIQFFVPITVTLLLLVKVFPDLNPGFGILLVTGFFGGHGTAAAVGGSLENHGWAEATDLGMTFATIGILTGIFGGLAFIKYATRKGYSSYIKDFKYISGDLRTGMVAKENRESLGEETISPVSLDTLCFHISLISSIAGAGFLLNRWIGANLIHGIPSFTIAYLVALVFFLIFRKRKLYDYIDRKINLKISGTATDYLIFFGLSSVKLSVIVAYALPILFMTFVGFALVFLVVFPLGYALNKISWFERSIFVYGYSAGVFAIGFVLLRIVDPQNKSKTIEDTAMTPLASFAEIIAWSTVPGLLVSGNGWWVVGATLMLTIICLALAIFSNNWWFKEPLSKREHYD